MAKSISSRKFYSMLVQATSLLESKVADINALNVFPVPDGDTGTNMFLTMKSIVDEIDGTSNAKPEEIIGLIARGSLLGARGNSGVILAQFFQGIAKVLSGKSSFDDGLFSDALKEAKRSSYEAVGNPVEGTMLTVISDIETAISANASESDLVNLWEIMVTAARKSVANTPNLLPVLKEAGVGDAGGQGLCVLLEGAFHNLTGESNLDVLLMAPDIKISAQEVPARFDFDDEHDEYGYCTQFLLKGISIDVSAMRDQMMLLANSTVVIGSEEMIRVHVHVVDPGPVLSHAVTLGTLSEVSIVNMDDQNKEFFGSKNSVDTLSIGILSIAVGSGFRDLFISAGASHVLEGGDTMNPSVKEILNAIESIEADTILVLPNNSNILYSAEQAGSLSSKKVEIVATKTMVEGVSAILSFNAEENVAVNLDNMNNAVAEVLSGFVCVAERDAKIDGVEIKKGQYIGSLNNKILYSGEHVSTTLFEILSKSNMYPGTLVTIYWGLESNEEESDSLAALIESGHKGVETEVVFGGQPYYNYILSLE